jgi:Tfp pilus assembly protein PilN
MLRTNLSTRPFYNVRAVQTLLMLVAAIVVAITLFNVVQFVRLSARERALGADAAAAETEAARLREQAARLHAQIDPKELEVVATAAREANAVIDQRAFSWTELFSQIERTLPENVRITAIQPHVERDGRFIVEINTEGRRVEDVDAFIEALEAQKTFRNVLPPQEQVNEDGLMEAVIRGEYIAQGARPTPPVNGAAR